jgi:outer membrane protein TolC
LKFKKIIFLILFFAASSFYLQAQKPLTLKECINYSNTHNSDIKIAGYDVTISQKQVNEQIGTMLPQVEISASYKDNLKLSTTTMDAALFGGKAGETIAITTGTQHNVTTEVSLDQKIYDPTFGAALKAAKYTKLQSEQTLQQTQEELVYNVSITFYETLVIQKETDVLKATLDSSLASLASTELKLKNGMAKKLDVDKIRVSSNNTRSSFQQSELSYKQSLNNLKYYMGMPVDSAIVLADTILSIVTPEIISIDSISVENHIDYKLKITSLQLYEANKKNEVAGYLPTLSFNAFYDYDAMRDQFNFFKSGEVWYDSYGIGLTLSIPVFDGLQRKSRIAQAKLEIKKAEENILLTSQSLKVDLSNYDIEYRNAIDNIKNEKENLDLAQSVYDNTQLGYKQGTSSALELVQAESSYREAQSNYFNKMLNLYIARIELEKSKGTLIEYINNIK